MIDFEKLAALLYCRAKSLEQEDCTKTDQETIRGISQELEMLEGLGARKLISCLTALTGYESEENPGVQKFAYRDFRKIMQEFQAAYGKSGQEIHGVIVFTKNSWDEEYPLAARSYEVTSENGWDPSMDGYAIYGSSLDGSDIGVRLERYMAEEAGGPDGWKADYCYLLPDPFIRGGN